MTPFMCYNVKEANDELDGSVSVYIHWGHYESMNIEDEITLFLFGFVFIC